MTKRADYLVNLAAAFSLAGLLFARVWAKLQSPWGWSDIAKPWDYAAALLNVTLATVVIYGLACLALRSRRPTLIAVVKFLFVIATLAGLWSLVSAIYPSLSSSDPMHPNINSVTTVSAASLTILVLILFAVRRRSTLLAARGLLLMLLPASIIPAAQSACHLAHRSAVRQTVPEKSSSKRVSAHKVVVILFDEMDQLTAFSERPSGLKMPEFDRLLSESTVGLQSYPPGYRTILSLPSFLTGKSVKDAEMLQSGGLSVAAGSGHRQIRLSKMSTIFTEVRSMGLQSALVSDVLPYGHILGQRPDFEYSRVYSSPESSSLAFSIVRQWKDLPAADRLHLNLVLESKEERQAQIRGFQEAASITERVAADSAYDFSFVHLCMPHEPFIYDRRRGDYSDEGGRTYADNLALSDRVLGEIRSAMESSGQWDSSSVIILSDHWWRRRPGKSDHRSVFIVKLPNQKSRFTYDKPFNSIVFHDLVLELLHGRLSSPSQLEHWIDSNSPFSESPITKSRL